MPSPLTSTTFAKLIKKFLKSLDNYNSDDLTRATDSVDSNSSGEVAGICLNLGLQTCYGIAKDSKYTKALPTLSLVTTVGQDYIDLDVEPYMDEIESIVDTTNNFRLVRRSWDFYRRYFANPEMSTGTPSYYIRRANRIYLAPRPTDVRVYLTDFEKFPAELVLDNDCPSFPTAFDFWIISEAKVKWYEMEDVNSVPAEILSERNDARQIAIDMIFSGFDTRLQSASHFGRTTIRRRDYRSPIGDGT